MATIGESAQAAGGKIAPDRRRGFAGIAGKRFSAPGRAPAFYVLHRIERVLMHQYSAAGLYARPLLYRSRKPARMWIVRVALDRPYTFMVLALLILILSPLVILETPTDIFPDIDIPVIAVAWTYTGLNPEEMEGRLTTVYERSLTTLVDNIQHIESTSYDGIAMVKIYLQPNASLDTANAQVTAASQQLLRQMPPGTQPPQILNYSASSVPILQLGLSGSGHVGAGAERHRPELPANPTGHGAGRCLFRIRTAASSAR